MKLFVVPKAVTWGKLHITVAFEMQLVPVVHIDLHSGANPTCKPLVGMLGAILTRHDSAGIGSNGISVSPFRGYSGRHLRNSEGFRADAERSSQMIKSKFSNNDARASSRILRESAKLRRLSLKSSPPRQDRVGAGADGALAAEGDVTGVFARTAGFVHIGLEALRKSPVVTQR